LVSQAYTVNGSHETDTLPIDAIKQTDTLPIEAILEQFDAYIVDLARRKCPRSVIPPEVVDLEIDELAQKTRIALWRTLQKRPILNLHAYIRTIVQHEAVNIVRRQKGQVPLPLDDDGELYQGNILVTADQGLGDPAWEIEQAETFTGRSWQAVNGVSKLPRCQQEAMICSLKERVDDLVGLIGAFQRHHVDIEPINWPKDPDKARKSKASLSMARKKLQTLLSLEG